MALSIDIADRALRIPTLDRVRHLSGQVALTFVSAAVSPGVTKEPHILFLPDGTSTGGRSMFGDGPRRPPDPSARQPAIPPPGGDMMVLLGVLLTRERAGRATTTILLKHGRPPIVSRLVPGSVVDGWTLVSATPTMATMARSDGATRLLQVGRSRPRS